MNPGLFFIVQGSFVWFVFSNPLIFIRSMLSISALLFFWLIVTPFILGSGFGVVVILVTVIVCMFLFLIGIHTASYLNTRAYLKQLGVSAFKPIITGNIVPVLKFFVVDISSLLSRYSLIHGEQKVLVMPIIVMEGITNTQELVERIHELVIQSESMQSKQFPAFIKYSGLLNLCLVILLIVMIVVYPVWWLFFLLISFIAGYFVNLQALYGILLYARITHLPLPYAPQVIHDLIKI